MKTVFVGEARAIGPAAANRQVDSPMSMTLPMTTLTRTQYAPLLLRSSAAPHSTLPQQSPMFLRRDLRLRADYFVNGHGRMATPENETRSHGMVVVSR